MEKKEIDAKIRAYTNTVILNIIVSIGLIVFIFISIVPGFEEYNVNKDSLLSQISKYENTNKNGLNFQEYSGLITNKDTKLLVSKIGVDFYNKNFKNTSSGSYIDFLTGKEKTISDLKKSDKIKIRDQKLSQVLPSYQDGVSIDGVMTDLEFVNYVEKLLRIFRLKTTSSIGIKNLVMVENKSTDTSKKNQLDQLSSQVFYSPLKLSLEGTKADIMDFVYFLQNVGKIDTVKQDNITFYNDNVLNNRGVENIYQSKLVNIDGILFYDYIDKSSAVRTAYSEKTTLGFLNFIRNGTDKDQAYKVDIDLKFFVKGLPNYKLKSYIEDLSKKHKDLIKKVQDSLNKLQSKTTTDNGDYVNTISNLKNINLYLSDLSGKIKSLETNVKQKNNLEKVYLDSSKIIYDLDNFEVAYNDIVRNINK